MVSLRFDCRFPFLDSSIRSLYSAISRLAAEGTDLTIRWRQRSNVCWIGNREDYRESRMGRLERIREHSLSIYCFLREITDRYRELLIRMDLSHSIGPSMANPLGDGP